ncbi:hypothetical protein UREG_07039 [Uncinocarpus reesii 1704]|uniref:Uncharacterized protein n=1 Tax=Uncinocarpus reesii (strain UAMH 1704) TaxID=336963 RepID=C4JXY8_UNCRE|nr:uncharacterized protein UREG_07039 [Uncinocarpus reesii 1704]EEP82174.1 hypothetical protein UREG_07039 [Uncinocarpus reesii 1704]
MVMLDQPHLRTVVSALAQKLDSLGIDYALMGGAAVCLLAPNPNRKTEDVDLVIHVDQRMITADQLTQRLLEGFPNDFGPVSQFGHTIPAFKLQLPGGVVHLVELEVFDYQSWPQRPQYNIPTASRTTINIDGQAVKVFGPEWLLREKILSQYQRQGSAKERVDVRDISNLIPLAVSGKPELDFNQNEDLQTALAHLVRNRPALVEALKAKIKCTTVFQN